LILLEKINFISVSDHYFKIAKKYNIEKQEKMLDRYIGIL